MLPTPKDAFRQAHVWKIQINCWLSWILISRIIIESNVRTAPLRVLGFPVDNLRISFRMAFWKTHSIDIKIFLNYISFVR